MKRTDTFWRLSGAVLALVVLAGCGPAKDATYENATKLREAVIASGVDCPGDAVKHDDKYGEDYVKCNQGISITVYTTDKDASLAQSLDDVTKATYLKGPRWVIHSRDVDTLGKLKDKLGGSLSVS